MKLALSLVFILLLSACASDSGEGVAGRAPAPRPEVPPGTEAEASWGMLTCQKRRNCEDPVLNQNAEKLVYFFAMNKKPMFDGEAAPFLCGRWLGRVWSEAMGSDGFDSRVGNFLATGFDLANCSARPLTVKKLIQYLTNHKEFKNEFH
jgi:hypothetical protein